MNEENAIQLKQVIPKNGKNKAFNLKKEPILLSTELTARNLMIKAIYDYQLEGKSEDYYPNLVSMAKMYIETAKEIKEQRQMKAMIREQIKALVPTVEEALDALQKSIKSILKGEDYKKIEDLFYNESCDILCKIHEHEDIVIENFGRAYAFTPTDSLEMDECLTPEWKRYSAMDYIDELPSYEFQNLIEQLESGGYVKVSWHKYMNDEPSEE
jgi:hypothetical protein